MRLLLLMLIWVLTVVDPLFARIEKANMREFTDLNLGKNRLLIEKNQTQIAYSLYILEAQKKLKNLGFYSGRLDGINGSQTKAAVKRFQNSRSRCLKVDGILGPETKRELDRVYSGNATNNCNSGIPSQSGGISQSGGPYVVVIPERNANTFLQVQRYMPNAYKAKNQQGPYIIANRYYQRDGADSLAKYLRSQGLEARVVYQP
jgi:peptidoglycan hydrolase-like protein with peptidoglycan-binding domain